MSHSKLRKNGTSLYVEKWNPSAKNYIHTCILCGRKGYSPAITQPDFACNGEKEAIRRELMQMFPRPLSVDEYGRCEHCASLQDGK